jgi:transcriptional regulatory protein LevR
MPVDSFSARLDLLVSSGQVTNEARSLTTEYLSAIETEFGIELREGEGSALVTHLAMGLTRLARNEPAIEAPPSLIDEVAGHPRELQFTRAQLRQCGDSLGCPLPESEIVFMAAHLCVLTATMQGSQQK